MAPVVVFNASPVGHVPTCDTTALPVAPKVAAEPFTVSFAATFAIGVDTVPATAVPLSGAGTIDAVTVTVSVVLAQLAGVFLSQSWYWTLYDPGPTAAVVVIAPLVAFSAIPVGHVPTCDTAALPPLPKVAAAPFTESFAATFVIGVEAAPATAVPLSATGTIDAVTVTVSVVVAQLAGVFLSQSWY